MAAILESNMATKSLEQLMGMFLAASGNFLPDTWRNLMGTVSFSFKYYEIKMAAILKSNMAAKDLEQLMCVFPAASGNFLPDTWRELLVSFF